VYLNLPRGKDTENPYDSNIFHLVECIKFHKETRETFSVAGVFNSTISEDLCWLEQVGVTRLKLTGVTIVVVGVNPVEVIKVSNSRFEITFEGVSITMPPGADAEFLASFCADSMFKLRLALLDLRPLPACS